MIKKSLFALLDDRKIFQFSIGNSNGTVINIINYGAIVKNIFFRNYKGDLDDIVLGYDSINGYIKDKAFIGTIVGRYGNRIANGKFKLKGIQYQLNTNDGQNHLHGGNNGFHKVIWEADEFENNMGASVRLEYLSPDSEEGYPGSVRLSVIYTLTGEDELLINYEGRTDKPTILNPTHHSYFNLMGNFRKDISEHKLFIDADKYIPVNPVQIPYGSIEEVKDTPFDFRTPLPIGLHINDDYEQLKYGKGYDHCWVLNNYNRKTKLAASLYEQRSRRLLEVFTDQPGLHFYSGNSLGDNISGKGGINYNFRCGLCLETQLYPDTPNNPSFPSAELHPDEVYKQETIYKFSIRK